MNAKFWKNRQVLLTGHTGFKGSWLALWLQAMGANVTGYALDPPSRPSLFELARVADGMDSRHGDVRDLPSLRAVMFESKPEVVIHMAAQSLVRTSYAEPVETFATNVMGTVHTLDAALACEAVRSVVIVTSDKCYENREWIWGYRENDPMGGYDPYSASKGCAELVTAAYRRSFGFGASKGGRVVGIATARAGNVIGGGDWSADRLVPDFFRAVLAGRKLTVRSPDATRPWQHVLEPLAGYLLLAAELWRDPAACSEAWNFGPDLESVQPVHVVADELTRLWGKGAGWRARRSGLAAHEAGLLALDASKARLRLGWQPRLRLEQALARTVKWYKCCAGRVDVRSLTMQQIREYLALGA